MYRRRLRNHIFYITMLVVLRKRIMRGLYSKSTNLNKDSESISTYARQFLISKDCCALKLCKFHFFSVRRTNTTSSAGDEIPVAFEISLFRSRFRIRVIQEPLLSLVWFEVEQRSKVSEIEISRLKFRFHSEHINKQTMKVSLKQFCLVEEDKTWNHQIETPRVDDGVARKRPSQRKGFSKRLTLYDITIHQAETFLP